MNNSKRDLLKVLLQSLISILIAIGLGMIIIFVVGYNPINAFAELFKGAFGSKIYIANTFSRAVPLIFTGLSVALSARCGMLNIGGEGQLYLGAMAVAIVGLYIGNLPHILAIIILIVVAFIGGMLGGSLCGFLKIKFGISEVISAIMLNYVFKLFTSWLAADVYPSGESSVQTIKLDPNLNLTALVKSSNLTTSVILVLIIVVALYIFLWKTTIGYKLRAVGFNYSAANSSGINAKLLMLLTMSLCGGLAGLAGGCEVLSNYHRFIEGFSPSYGFTGIAVAILGRNHPFAVILTALLFATLDSGALRMARVTGVSSSVIAVIKGLIIMLVAAPELIKIFKQKEVNK